MDIQSLSQIIGNGFFPIGMCVALFYYMTIQNKNHKEEVDGLKDVLNSVQITLAELRDAIKGDK